MFQAIRRVKWEDAKLRWWQEQRNDCVSNGEYRKVLDRLDEWFGGRYLDEIGVEDVLTVRDEWRAEGVADSTITRRLVPVKTLFRAARNRWKAVADVPDWTELKLHGGKVRQRWLTVEEFKLVEAELAVFPTIKRLARFAVLTGFRPANVVGFQWDWVDMATGRVEIPFKELKTGWKVRENFVTHLNEMALQVLREVKGQHPVYAFVKPSRKPYEAFPKKVLREVSARLAARQKAQGRDFKPFVAYTFRHTWATWHLRNGTDSMVLMKLGGWASPDMPSRYAKLASDQQVKEAQNVCKGLM